MSAQMKLCIVFTVMGIIAASLRTPIISNKMSNFITKVTKSDLHISRPVWWLESRFHFSFADWHGPGIKQQFGALRVLNDDLVKAGAGFGAHPHRDAEIFSYVVDGALTHADSMGNKESLPAGGVQYMSAGRGVVHSEMNEGASTCRFLQVWLTPDAKGHTPQYGSLQTTTELRRNRLLAVLQGTGTAPAWASPMPGDKPVKLHQDATVTVSQADAGLEQKVALVAGRQAYVVCIEGSLEVSAADGGVQLGMREAAEVAAGGQELGMGLKAGPEGAHFMLIEMKGAGR